MEQHPVPQNVTTFQFRLIGDMTIKQFGYLAGGTALGYICYRLPLPIFFGLPLSLGIFLLGFGMAFVPVEERPMDVWVLSFIKSIYSPTLYVWQRQKQAPPAQGVPPVIQQAPPSSAANIPAPTVMTKPESAPMPPSFPTPPAMQPQPFQAPASPPVAPEPKPEQVVGPTPATPNHHGEPVIDRHAAQEAPLVPPTIEQQAPARAQQQPDATERMSPFQAFLAWLFPKPTPTPTNGPKKPTANSTGPHPSLNQTDILSGIFAHRAKPPSVQTTATPIKSVITPKGPDVFANMQIPSITGNQPVPVQLPTTEQRIKEDPVQDAQSKKDIENLAQKNKELETKLAELAEKLSEKATSESRILELQKQLTDVLSERQQMQTDLSALRSKLSQQTAPQQQPTQTAGVVQEERRGPTVRVIAPEAAVKAGLPKLTTFPNVVTGIIKDCESNLLPGVLVTVRDSDGVPLRALKTNKLGQFAASTPLPNATYFIEVEDPRGRFTFDRIQITLNGSIVPAVEVAAKSQKQIEREKLEKQIFGSQQF